MTGMEPPNSFSAEDVRTEKAKLVEAVHPVEITDIVRGQYTAGTEFGQPVAGYRQEANVDPNSRTETYVAAKLKIENWRWAGVPFYLRTGKRLAARRTEIAIHFKPAPYQIFRDTPVDQLTPNIVKLLIDPEQGISDAVQREGARAGDEAGQGGKRRFTTRISSRRNPTSGTRRCCTIA